MAEDTSIKFYSYDMLRAPSFIPSNTSLGVRNMFNNCLVTGFGQVPIISGNIVDGVCRLNVASGNSFSTNATILLENVSSPVINGEHKVSRSSELWFEFKTDLPDGPITGSGITAKYAPAGWEHPFAPSGEYAVYRSKNTSSNSRRNYLQLREISFNEVRVRAFQTMHDNLNGTGMYPTIESGQTNGMFFTKCHTSHTVPLVWFILASDTFFYYVVSSYYTNGLSYPFCVNFFGDTLINNTLDKDNVVLKGYVSHAEANSGGSSTYEFGVSNASGASYISCIRMPSSVNTPIRIPLLASMYANVINIINNPLSGAFNSFSNFTDPYTGAFNLTDYRVQDNNGFDRGKLPGVYFIKNGINRVMQQFQITEGSGDLQGKKLLGIFTTAGQAHSSSVTGSGSNTAAYLFFDITGPWVY